MKVTYDQGSEFIGHEFRKYLIEKEYGITDKQRTSGNPTSNEILKWINQILGNLVQNSNIKETYVDKDDPWPVILAAAVFAMISTSNRLKVYIPFQLLFLRDIILPLKHTVDWLLIRQQRQTQNNKENIRKI